MNPVKMSTFAAVFVATLAISAATDPLTITLGSTAYVLSASQVSIAVASLAALAIAKEVLILSALKRGGRGRRDINTVSQIPLNFESFFDSIAKSDVADCGKLLVCHSMSKTENTLTSEEKAITKLFDNLEMINPYTGYAEYQLAAYAGTYKQPELCNARYSRCPLPAAELGNLIKIVDPVQNL